jgi:glucosyl-3-phosphoglycerate synthase
MVAEGRLRVQTVKMGGVLRSFHHRRFPAEAVAAAKRGRRVTLCLPARDEAPTVGAIVGVARRELAEVVDEVLVVDDGSTDGTAAVARAAGARVVSSPGAGKGRAMWRGVQEAEGDVVAFCDADLRNFAPRFVTGLLGPLLTEDGVAFVKGWYERPFEGQAGQGGRVTELMAKPALRVLFPALAPVLQPLGGECAARRDVLEQVPFVEGWGVDIGLVIDVAEVFGMAALAQVDLGERVHRNRPLEELGPQAEAILRTALARAGLGAPVAQCPPLTGPGRRTA